MRKFRKKLSKYGELEAIKRWLGELRQESEKKPIIVEGKKDSITLAKFGIKTVQIHNVNVPLHERIEELANNKECILLLDLDKAGKKLHAKVKESLQNNKVKINSHFRNFLLAKTRLRVIEGLDTYIQTLEKNQ